jgi:hypothetical protein
MKARHIGTVLAGLLLFLSAQPATAELFVLTASYPPPYKHRGWTVPRPPATSESSRAFQLSP